MGRQPVQQNPFRPGAGALPPVLAGRSRELALGDQLLDLLGGGGLPSRGLLFFGPRGNGKTTLLARIAEEARRRGLSAERLPAAVISDERRLIRRLQERTGLLRASITGAQAAGFGISANPAPVTEDVEELVLAWIRASQSPLVILLDEAHTVEPETGRLFFDAMQEATARSLPFLLLAAGTPDAPRRLRQCGTFTERALERVPVERLERQATLEALTEPAKLAGLPFRENAAAQLAAESQDYPYFIQLLGRAAWDAAGPGAAAITREASRQAAATARAEMERFYAERYAEGRSRGIAASLIPLATLFSDRGGRVKEAELQPLLAESAKHASVGDDPARLLETLSDLGVLWETRPSEWELGIPSFAEFVMATYGARDST